VRSSIFRRAVLTADKVLVTVGTPCSISAVGSTQTFRARVTGARELIAYAAFDAGLVDLEIGDDGALAARWREGGEPASLEAIEERHGARLRAGMGIRFVEELTARGADVVTDIAAPLPHDFARGGLRRLAGLSYQDVRESALKNMYGLFEDDPRLGPSLQAQLFAYTGLGALAALPVPLAELLPNPYQFRVAAATAFQGLDAFGELRGASAAVDPDRPRDKFAARLASSLGSHGPALLSTMLAPSYSLSRSLRNPALLESLRSPSGYMRVPQTPLTAVGACASSAIAFCELAPQMMFDYPGYERPVLALWTGADAATHPDWQILDAFGPGALMTRAKLDECNAGRPAAERRGVADCLAPFDRDGNGTVVGEGGSGLLVTTLDFALKNFLDITSIIVGWGQSGEAGGKAHFAGVGFGGENASIHAYELAYRAHGYGLDDFQYLVAHATGTRTNSKTDLTTAANALAGAAHRQGRTGPSPRMVVGAPKALGDGHTMGETGLKAVAQALQYLLGQPAVGVPTLRHLDPELGAVGEAFVLRADNIAGNPDGGAICATQGFGGYNGAVALRAAHAGAFARYVVDAEVLAAYLERWPEVRRERERRERYWRSRRRAAIELAERHCWKGSD
jgi:3-oxoacyl-[acyl-carrier-protein] synthase II